ncbi:substrate-binding periplasmic protein [Rheinheimera sp.]|uniref:substrate-binding periplasmic protein n=1 Tax=Rheinheimera sp. TaxID=1869214 RepID=UPI003AF93680
MRSILLCLSLCLVSLVQAAPIKVGLHDSAPWAYRDSQGQITGIDYDIVQTILRQQGIEAKFELYSYSRLLKLFSERKLDMASPVAVPYPGAYYSQPYFTIQDVVVSRRQVPLQIRTLADLKGKSIVAYQQASSVLGPDFAQQMKQAFYLEEADRKKQFELLFNDRVQLIIGDERVLTYYSHTYYGPNLLTVYPIFPPVDYPAAFWSAELQQKFNQGLQQLQAEGKLSEYYQAPRF